MKANVSSYRAAALAALLVLLPVNGYIWSLPITVPMLITVGILMALTVVALLLFVYFSALSERETSSLAGELQKKSAQVLELVEAEREDDRIIQSLTERINQLKSTLIVNQSKHVPGEPGIVFPAATSSAVLSGSIEPVVSVQDHQTLHSHDDFRLLATQFARVASRYDRHFTVMRLRMNVAERSRVVGAQRASEEYQAAIGVIAKTLRNSDFAASEGAESLIIGYPETSATHVDAILSRLRAVLRSSDARNLDIEMDRTDASEESSQT